MTVESRALAPAVQRLSDLHSVRRLSSTILGSVRGVVNLVSFQGHKALNDDSLVGLCFVSITPLVFSLFQVPYL